MVGARCGVRLIGEIVGFVSQVATAARTGEDEFTFCVSSLIRLIARCEFSICKPALHLSPRPSEQIANAYTHIRFRSLRGAL